MEFLCAAWRFLHRSPFFLSLSKMVSSVAAGCRRGMPRWAQLWSEGLES